MIGRCACFIVEKHGLRENISNDAIYHRVSTSDTYIDAMKNLGNVASRQGTQKCNQEVATVRLIQRHYEARFAYN